MANIEGKSQEEIGTIENEDRIHDDHLGEVEISDDVIAVCAINACLRTDGVVALAGGLTDTIAKTIRGRETLSKGVKISQGEDGITVDVYVIVEYGVKIPACAWDIQTNVKEELETMTEHPVAAVNIHVQGVEKTTEE